MKVSIVGGGNLGTSLVRALLRTQMCQASDIVVYETAQHKRAILTDELGCAVEANIDERLRDAAVVWLAVKPQDAPVALRDIAPFLTEQILTISPMAGITLATLDGMLGKDRKIVRCMPNLAAEVGEAMTVYCPNASITHSDLGLVEKIFCAFGKCLRVSDEQLVNAATALSGSGPAYLFYLIEHLLSAGGALGFTATESEQLVAQTIRGALELWQSKKVDPGALRRAVTSPQGTTAAAFAVFEEAQVGEALQRGVQAAFRRAQQLSSIEQSTQISSPTPSTPAPRSSRTDQAHR